VGRLLDQLSIDETQEYEDLRARSLDYDAGAFERTVALAHLAVLSPMLPMPEPLRAAVRQDFEDSYVGGRNRRREDSQLRSRYRQAFRAAVIGWILAAAASCAAIFLVSKGIHEVPVGSGGKLIWGNPQPPAAAVVKRPGSAATIPTTRETEPSLASQREAFLATHTHVIQRAWREGGDYTGAGVRGDVIWDEASQTGYMRFVNLKHNEPNAEQYQLWIFDGARDQRYPVDGGVFDVVAREGEVIVPIRAKLPVRVPLAFAVTVERRGGVVVSDRSRLAVIANIS